MAVLNKEAFLKRVQEKLGDDKSDEAIAFLEDVTDTYNDLESKTKGDEDWKKKYEENDAEWRKKYTERFFTPEQMKEQKEKEEEKEKELDKQESIQIKDLFTDK